MTQKYFPISTLLGIVTGCNNALGRYTSEFDVLDYMMGRVVAVSEYALVLMKCRAKILELYPGLFAENNFNNNVHLLEEEQDRILAEMRENFKEQLVNDCLPISRLPKL